MARAVSTEVASQPLQRQQAWLAAYHFGLRLSERGKVSSLGDGIVWVEGLPSARLDELIGFADGSEAMVIQLSADRIGAILLKGTQSLKAGMDAYLSGRGLGIAVGDDLLGRVIDPLGYPLDGQPPAQADNWHALDIGSPPIVERDFVEYPLYTGIKIVDTMIPIGRGQRQLIIGDHGTGKSALALDTVINQRGNGVRCVYVLIGQKRSSVVQTVETLRQSGALAHTTLVVAEATATPGIKYLAPFAGCAVAEEWMRAGHDTLVVYDDLSTHARAYRELSLLLRRPPGREAYPGDIFYLHARLLERSTRLAAKQGGGSMTALPIVETEQGEIAAYIPTNLISITDGQIYLDTQLFARGSLPAIDITRSVSRIGGKAQDEAIKREAGRTKLDFLQFLELEVFTRFGAKLDASMDQRIGRGQLLREILKQERLDPQSIASHMAWLVAYNSGFLDNLRGEALARALAKLRQAADTAELGLAANPERWHGAVRAWLEMDGDEQAA